jgi:hypothetical protein
MIGPRPGRAWFHGELEKRGRGASWGRNYRPLNVVNGALRLPPAPAGWRRIREQGPGVWSVLPRQEPGPRKVAVYPRRRQVNRRAGMREGRVHPALAGYCKARPGEGCWRTGGLPDVPRVYGRLPPVQPPVQPPNHASPRSDGVGTAEEGFRSSKYYGELERPQGPGNFGESSM